MYVYTCIYITIKEKKKKQKTVVRGEKVCRHKRNELVHTVANTIHISKELAPGASFPLLVHEVCHPGRAFMAVHFGKKYLNYLTHCLTILQW